MWVANSRDTSLPPPSSFHERLHAVKLTSIAAETLVRVSRPSSTQNSSCEAEVLKIAGAHSNASTSLSHCVFELTAAVIAVVMTDDTFVCSEGTSMVSYEESSSMAFSSSSDKSADVAVRLRYGGGGVGGSAVLDVEILRRSCELQDTPSCPYRGLPFGTVKRS